MSASPFTVLLDGVATAGPAVVRDGRVRLDPDPIWSVLGAPAQGGADLAELARSLDRSLAVDLDEHAAFLGVSARARGAQLWSLEAPDFTLPDLEGRPHALSAQRGHKVLVVAYGSW
jgi:hypothetical protein